VVQAAAGTAHVTFGPTHLHSGRGMDMGFRGPMSILQLEWRWVLAAKPAHTHLHSSRRMDMGSGKPCPFFSWNRDGSRRPNPHTPAHTHLHSSRRMDMGLETHVHSSAITEMGCVNQPGTNPSLLLPKNGHGFGKPMSILRQ